jgi:hypothetical protein
MSWIKMVLPDTAAHHLYALTWELKGSKSMHEERISTNKY